MHVYLMFGLGPCLPHCVRRAGMPTHAHIPISQDMLALDTFFEKWTIPTQPFEGDYKTFVASMRRAVVTKLEFKICQALQKRSGPPTAQQTDNIYKYIAETAGEIQEDPKSYMSPGLLGLFHKD